mgnify:CR=1 FL=1
MPSWKKIIQSGSDAHLSKVTASSGVRASTGSFDIITGSLDISNLSQVASDITPTKDDVLKFNGTEFVSVPEGTTFEFSLASFTVNGEGNSSQLIGTGNWTSASSVSYTAEYNNGPPASSIVTIAGNNASTFQTTLTNVGNDGSANEANSITFPTLGNNQSENHSITFQLNADGNFSSTTTVRFRNLFLAGQTTSTNDASQANIEALESQTSILPSNNNDITHTFTQAVGASNYLVIAHRKGTSTNYLRQVRCGEGTNVLTVAMNPNSATSRIAHTTADYENPIGFEENFRYYRSKLVNLSSHSNEFQTLNTTAVKNYIYWGLTEDSTGYDESTIESLANKDSSIDDGSLSNQALTIGTFTDKFVLIAVPSRYSTLSFKVTAPLADANFGFSTIQQDDVVVTNVVGFQETYNVYRSAQLLTYSDLEITAN